MRPERWQQIEKLYHSALKQEASRRTAFLKDACAGDEDVRREVESLLAQRPEAESFIESPALEVTAQGMAETRAQSMVGRQLGAYQILSLLGAGGMGEVYRAKDTRLDRTVAIKVLPAGVSNKPEMRQRFEREARAISNLNHPHICTLYDIGRQDGVDFLVMEYLEGETLADRLAKGALAMDQALRFAVEIADALDQAHRHGVVHRDLKPGNIMMTKSGAKLLDFGLAKLRDPKSALALSSPSGQPTERASLTTEGTILGTLHYMAPEQLEGKEVDARADVFAFGAVVFEMVTGKKAFQGESTASVIAAILSSEPAPISTLQPISPPLLDRVVKRCLAKDPDDRWQTARDLMLELKWLAEGGSRTGLAASIGPQRQRREHIAWTVAGIFFLTALTLGVAFFRRTPTDMHILKFSVFPPEKTTFAFHAISPDGQRLAFLATPGGKTSLWVRPLDSLGAVELAGTEGATYPFWSPDGQFIGFFADSKLKKIAVSGGPPQAICDAGNSRGGTWNREGEIVFAPNLGDVLYRVSAAGGPATPVTTLEQLHGENSHRWPYFLPDSRHFVYWVRCSKQEFQGLYIGSLGSKDKRLLLSDAGTVAYTDRGYLLFVRDGTLLAQRFDVKSLRTAGEPLSIAQEVGYEGLHSSFSLSENGILTYQRPSSNKRKLVWFNREGKQLESVAVLDRFRNTFRLSPNEKMLAGDRLDHQTKQGDIWLFELSRKIQSRFTIDPSYDFLPVWSPDGSRIVFASNRNGPFDLYMRALSSTGGDEVLLKSDRNKAPTDWSRDGQFILYEMTDSKTGKNDLWVLPMSDRQPRPFLQSEFDERQGQFSPDGRWVAYSSDESGRNEVYAQSFPTPGEKRQISTSGGAEPNWRRDGKELFYLGTDHKLMAVEIKSSRSTFETTSPKSLFEMAILATRGSNYAVSADGQGFLVNTILEETKPEPINIIVNWTVELPKN